MVRVITQETFDEVVKENIEEFEMSPEEAVKDAVKQFEAQGVNLDNIKKTAMDNIPIESKDKLKQAVDDLNEKVRYRKRKDSNVLPSIEIIASECKKGLPQKVLAGKLGAYDALIEVLDSCEDNEETLLQTLQALIELMDGNPDLLTEKGVQLINDHLSKPVSSEVKRRLLKWTKLCCIKHEPNRQCIYNSDIVARLKELMVSKRTSAAVMKEACGVARALVLDDDVREPFGKSHEHARGMAGELIVALTQLLKEFRPDKSIIGDVMMTLSALVVRNEICAKVADSGGIEYIRDIFIAYPECEKINAMALRLLKGLAGNDDVKDKIIDEDLAPLFLMAMHRHVESPRLSEVGCAAIAALCLRKARISKVLYDTGAPEVIIECMKRHPNDYNVQKQGSWAIRNMVSRDKSLCDGFLVLEAEEVLRSAIKEAKCDYDAELALRDLGIEGD